MCVEFSSLIKTCNKNKRFVVYKRYHKTRSKAARLNQYFIHIKLLCVKYHDANSFIVPKCATKQTMREPTTESSPMTSHNEMLDETAIYNNSTADLMFSRIGRKHRNHTPSIICVIVVYCFTLGFRCQSVVASSQYYFSGASSSYYAESNTTTSYFILPKKCIHM